MKKTRSELQVNDKWNVEALYSDSGAWGKDFLQLKGRKESPRWPELAQFKGKLNDPYSLLSLLNFYFKMNRNLSKVHTYAHLRHDEDLGNDDYKRDYGMVTNLIHDFQSDCAWIEPELLRLEESDFRKLCSHPDLKFYKFFLEQIGRRRPHTLTSEMEELMSLSAKALDASGGAFSALNNADMVFQPAVDSEGKDHPLSHASYLSYLRSSDRTLRKTAFENLLLSYQSHENTLCELLQGEVQAHLFQAKARKFKNCLEAALFPHNIQENVYENLIASVRRAQPLMHRYISMRKKILGLPELHFYDLMVPLVNGVEIEMSYPEAADLVVKSVGVLGSSYQDALAAGLKKDRWVDVYETPRKRSGAYSSGCYDSMPYILMNYQGTFNDVLTLAHEAGHSMHSYLSRLGQPYVYAQYPIFVAEVASTFNEQLLLKELKSKAKSKKELAYIINYEMEGIRGTIYRQTLFAEFERQIHQWAEEGTPLTPTLLKEYYIQLNRDYYGPDFVCDQLIEIEWARIPHFYYNFYVYQYATGLSAALALFEKVQKSDEAKDNYLAFLGSGGSRYPLDLLALAGVDMSKADPVDQAMKRFSHLMDEFERCLEDVPQKAEVLSHR